MTNEQRIAAIKADLEAIGKLIGMPTPKPAAKIDAQRRYDELHEEAYIAACELQSPNSADFEELWESTFERMCEKAGL